MSDLHNGRSVSEPNVCPCCERADESAIRHGKELHAITVERDVAHDLLWTIFRAWHALVDAYPDEIEDALDIPEADAAGCPFGARQGVAARRRGLGLR